MVKLIGLDTETIADKDNVHRFYSFQTYTEDYKKKRVFSTDEDDFRQFLTDEYNRAWFVTFNLAFDGIVISRIIENKGYNFTAVFAGSRITRCTIRRNKRKWVLVDLRNIFPQTNLATIGEAIKFKKLEKPAYLGKREPTKREFPNFYKYAMRDAEICYKMASLIRTEFQVFKSTCAGLAIRVFKRDYCHIRKFPRYNDVLNTKLRLAYHGGRTECYIRGVNTEKIKVYDVNSLYPYVMKTQQYPNVLENFAHLSSVDLDHEGIAHVNVTQDANFPVIGIKHLCEDGLEKLCFPNGTFDCWATYPELRELESTSSGKINKVYESYEWQNSMNPFKEYIDAMYEKKQQASLNNSPKRMLYKIMLNSTYGKFGEHGTCTFATFKGDKIIEQNTPEPQVAWYHSVPIAAYITAYARLHTWHIIRSLNPSKIYYTDTDCAHTSEDLTALCNDKLGSLKEEKTADKGRACYIRSKFYMLNDTVTMKGFSCHDDARYIKLSIFQNDFRHYEHRITKILESARLHKPALFEYSLQKRFTIEPDGKRIFKRHLDHKTILFEQSLSKPIEVKN